MAIWLIEPRDPLIVRDGRPFDPTPGAQAISLPFPFPSTTTGGARSRAGLDKDGIFPYSQGSKELEELKKLKVRGPLLVQLSIDKNNGEEQWLAPAPLDALVFSGEAIRTVILKQLLPLEVPKGAQSDFDQINTENLTLVGLVKPDPNKPVEEAPRYWHWNMFKDWLLDPSRYKDDSISEAKLGHSGPQREQRIHVSIDLEKLVAKEGALFATSGLEFTHTNKNHEKRLRIAQQMALAIDVEENEQFQIQEGLGSLGGERRIVRWRRSNSGLPQCPSNIEQNIIEDRACRVVLLTPASFEQGYRPQWLLKELDEVTPKLEAIAIQRPQVASGWDLENRRPKQSRRLAPAGSVFFLSLEGNENTIRKWVSSIWMQCISDDEQSRLDGFGLAVLGTWSGKRVAMQ